MKSVIEAEYPLSPIQQGLLFHHLSGVLPGVDLEQIVCTLREELDPDVLVRAFEATVRRHDALRTSFRWEDVEEPLQRVHREAPLAALVQDWRDAPPEAQPARLAAFLRADRARGFDLREPPRRLALLRTGAHEHEVVFSFHHILLDGRSFPIVLREVFARYDALRRGETLRFPPARPYREHVEHLHRQDLAGAEPFWRERLAGFHAATKLPGVSRHAASAIERGERTLRLSRETTAALAEAARRHGVALNTVVQGAFALLLARHSGESDVVFGATRAGRATSVEGAHSMAGLFINTLPVRVRVPEETPVGAWLRELHERERAVRSWEHVPLVDVQHWSEVAAGQPLFESLVVFDHGLLDSQVRAAGGSFEGRSFRLHERTNYPLTLYAYAEPELLLLLAYDEARFDDAGAERILGHLGALLEGIAVDPERNVGSLSLLTSEERTALLETWNATARPVPPACVHERIREQAARTPDAVALACGEEALSYRELDERSNRLAQHLRALGVGVETLVGVCLERSLDLVVTVLAVLKAGGAYLPLDPDYPAARLLFMAEDSKLALLVTRAGLAHRFASLRTRVLELDTEAAALASAPSAPFDSGVRPEHLAYVIYTSGSTGRPKGVMVEHRNVVSFFAGMDERVPNAEGGVWLAVTSLSFDISVLELLWTLTHGFRVVVHAVDARAAPALRAGERPLEFSLFYFASDEGSERDKYRLLLEGARFADTHDFAAVWTPERHFHAFGGLYPNPAVTGAALAAVTQRVRIRAGSVVLPLHHPARVAEEWALVDNLSGGRVDVSVAAGWQPNDFVLRPESYAEARKLLFRELDTVRRLWRGEAVSFAGPQGPVEVRTLPRPIQPELPVWITSAGSVETFRQAGEIGANVLTHLLGQTHDEVAERIRVYRQALREHGHAPESGRVTLMVHTFLGDDVESVRATVREPMLRYLRSSLSLIKGFAGAWTAFKKTRDGSTVEADLDVSALTPEELDDLLAYSFERYFETSALFGTPEGCVPFVRRLAEIGVDEVACLVDFGVPADTVLAHLPQLDQLRRLASEPETKAAAKLSLAEAIRRHGATHLQCTPSLAGTLALDADARGSLGGLAALLLGGEALPGALAAQLRTATPAPIVNMYGPTETTIWSATHTFAGETEIVPIGRPIANTELYVLDASLRPVPVGVAGELYIGGAGVARGYLGRPELTAERFVPHPFRSDLGARLYRTGDRVRYRADGVLEFLGRMDQQLKLRGHRIEPGEIEATLARQDAVGEVAVVAREDEPGDVRLVAYLVARAGARPTGVDLRRWLAERLPEPMLPSHFVWLDALPRTPNQKLDRKALPAPGEPTGAAPEPARGAPAGELEQRIAEVWREVLRVPSVGLEDNFFDLGGHSLLAVRLHRRLRQTLERELAITDLFRFPTVRALARHLAGAAADPALDASRERGQRRREALARRRAAPGEPA